MQTRVRLQERQLPASCLLTHLWGIFIIAVAVTSFHWRNIPRQFILNPGADSMEVLLDERRLCEQASGLDEKAISALAAFARERGQSLFAVMVERGQVNEENFLERLAPLLDLTYLPATAISAGQVLPDRVAASLATKYRIVPVGERDEVLRVVCSDPFNWREWDDLRHLLDRPLEQVLASRATVARLLKESYGLGAETVERLMLDRKGDDARPRLGAAMELGDEDAANEPTVVNLVNRIISEAIAANATDIHFEPYEDKCRVRYRVDGLLEEVSIPQSVRHLKGAIVSRVKIMANLDITEKRLPQDGRARVTLKSSDFDLRVSILPGVFGEAINIRLLSRQMVQLELSGLGFHQDEQDAVERLIRRPHGLVLVTGPTGSGKTTTLYTCLSRINRPDTKIITVEDPVEYWMDDILQMQVHEEIGFGFSRALRSMLRHDPDIMLIGEIRDRETADVTIRSALTGHLVFATLHTNDAPTAVSRLVDIGVEPFLAASSISGIVAQRLVRRICDFCKEEVAASAMPELEVAWQGRGCERCRFMGYKGRTVVAEILTVTPAIRSLIQERAAADQLKATARREGMRTLRDSAVRAVREGRTTEAEAIRVTQEDEAS